MIIDKKEFEKQKKEAGYWSFPVQNKLGRFLERNLEFYAPLLFPREFVSEVQVVTYEDKQRDIFDVVLFYFDIEKAKRREPGSHYYYARFSVTRYAPNSRRWWKPVRKELRRVLCELVTLLEEEGAFDV